jgi:hypothetical protein
MGCHCAIADPPIRRRAGCLGPATAAGGPGWYPRRRRSRILRRVYRDMATRVLATELGPLLKTLSDRCRGQSFLGGCGNGSRRIARAAPRLQPACCSYADGGAAAQRDGPGALWRNSQPGCACAKRATAVRGQPWAPEAGCCCCRPWACSRRRTAEMNRRSLRPGYNGLVAPTDVLQRHGPARDHRAGTGLPRAGRAARCRP